LGIITMAGSLRGVEEYWCSQSAIMSDSEQLNVDLS
jgi:hypothetical protein